MSGDTEQIRPRARAMLFDLYGDFAGEEGRAGVIRLAAIVHFAADLGVTETATRSAANRLVQDGWLAAERRGRESLYRLTSRGQRLVEEGRERIFAPSVATWDGSWCAVALSVPEANREVRDRLRKELSWLGFGSPSHALYLSPRDHRVEVTRRATEVGAEANVQVYRAEALWPADPRDLVGRAWPNLTATNDHYDAFIQRFTRGYARDRQLDEAGYLAERDAFRTRFALVSQFRRCLYGDPDLPLDLLPADWHGAEARRLFLAYHELVTPAALAYFDRVNAPESRPLPAAPGV